MNTPEPQHDEPGEGVPVEEPEGEGEDEPEGEPHEAA